MKWLKLPVAILLMALGGVVNAQTMAPIGRVANGYGPAPNGYFALASCHGGGCTGPAPVSSGCVSGGFVANNYAPAGCASGGCGGATFGGYSAPSWAGGCCDRQPNCCDNVWDDYVAPRGRCNRNRGCGGRAMGCCSVPCCGPAWGSCGTGYGNVCCSGNGLGFATAGCCGSRHRGYSIGVGCDSCGGMPVSDCGHNHNHSYSPSQGQGCNHCNQNQVHVNHDNNWNHAVPTPVQHAPAPIEAPAAPADVIEAPATLDAPTAPALEQPMPPAVPETLPNANGQVGYPTGKTAFRVTPTWNYGSRTPARGW